MGREEAVGCTYLADAEPELGFFEVGCGFVKAAEEPSRDFGSRVVFIGSLEQPGKDVGDIHCVADVCRVLWWTCDDEVITEKIVCVWVDDSLVSCDFLGSGEV